MNQYLFLFRGGDDTLAELSAADQQKHMEKWFAWMEKLAAEDRLISAEPLHTTGKTINADKVVSDGPFMEGKEMVGGYLICRASSYEEATALAKACPVLEFEDGNVEIRELNLIDEGEVG
jgi:hypothetical protein